MSRRELWRERVLPILAFPGVLAAVLLLDVTWMAPRRANLSWEEAAAFWEEQAARRPDYGTSQLRLAIASATLGRWEEALGAYDRALRADPDLEQAASGRATALAELGRGAQGRADLERFYAEHPRCAVCALSLALWDAAAGEAERALARAERAAALAAERSDRTLEHDAWLVAAQLRLERAPARALAHARSALAAVPDSPGASQLAGQARARLRGAR